MGIILDNYPGQALILLISKFTDFYIIYKIITVKRFDILSFIGKNVVTRLLTAVVHLDDYVLIL